MRDELATAPDLVSSVLLLVEGRRAAARYSPFALDRARAALSEVTLLPLDDVTLEDAARLEPLELRSLDALHLATAVGLDEDLRCFYCYDGRLASAATALGIEVRAPA